MGQTSLQISKRVKKAEMQNTHSQTHLDFRFRKIMSERSSSLNPSRPHFSTLDCTPELLEKQPHSSIEINHMYGKNKDLGAKTFSLRGTVPRSINSPFK